MVLSSYSSTSYSSLMFKIQCKTHSYTSFTPTLFAFHTCNDYTTTTTRRSTRKTPETTKSKWVLRNNNPAVVLTSSSPYSSIDSSASNIVRKFYQGINGHDLASVEPLIAENCVYEDLIFPQPFVGRKAILEFFKKFTDSISTDLQFAIDELSEEDSSAVGVTWHLEWKGKPFPFSKGCSFYRLEIINGQRQITYGRDSVEPAIKPGETALGFFNEITLSRITNLGAQNAANQLFVKFVVASLHHVIEAHCQ